VNVFLGLGLPWLIAVIYYKSNPNYEGNMYYKVPSGQLAFSVVLFLITSCLCLFTIVLRRKIVGAELGGSKNGRWGSAIWMVSLWLFYVVMSTLQVYDVISGF
jgi:solute carrier family 8 (sodium/calcium exchanger)